MTDKYFAEYTGIEVKQFRKTLLQYTSNVKKFVAERTRHKRLYDRRVNKRQMQKQESKVDLGKALDAGLVVTKCSGTKLEVQDTSSRSGDDADADNADIKPVYDEEPMAYVQLTDKCNNFATGQQHTEQPEFNNEANMTYMKLKPLTSNWNIFAKPSVLGKPVLQPLTNQSIVRQPTAFKSERPRISKPRFASQVDVKNDLSKPITQHYLPKRRESAFAKPDHVIASSESRNSSKNMPRLSLNDMVHNHYLEEAKKKTQER
ncbi:hypothetical protein Tco_1250273 [Tanacetum coccineum]